MARSIKKGPFIDGHLLSKIEKAQARAPRRSSRPGLVAQRCCLKRLALPSPYTMVASSCPCSSRSTWLATSSASFAPTRTFNGHAGDKKKAAGAR